MDGARISARAPVLLEDGKNPAFVGSPWKIIGVGDFNRDGGPDIFWHNTDNRQTQVWLMDGRRISSRHTLVAEDGKTPMGIGPPFEVVGIGDFDHDGGTDILFRNTSDNTSVVWLMDGIRVRGRNTLLAENGQTPMNIGPPFEVIGIGDFSRDGGGDILFRNTSNNATTVWVMDGIRIRGRNTLLAENGQTPMNIGPPFEVIGIGDFNRDGGGDILFRNTSDNATTVWVMDGIRIHSRITLVAENGQTPITIGAPWSVVGIGVDRTIQPKPGHDKPDNPELGNPTGQGPDKNKQDPPTDPPPEQGPTKNNPVKPEGPQFTDGPPATETGCFVGSTQVLMADGLTKRIDAIAIGDHVMARDEKTGLVAVGAVDRVFRHHVAETLLLKIDGGEVVETTAGHRFAAQERGFVSAGQLLPGDRLSTHNERDAAVVSTRARSADATVYNLSVDRLHTFFIGGAGLWVHNVKDANPEHKEPDN